VLLNTRIAQWDNTSPNRPTDQTRLHFEESGLAGFEQVGPLEFRFTPDGNDPLWDVRSATKLPRNDDGSVTVQLAPGRGVVLMQGTDGDMKATTERLNGA